MTKEDAIERLKYIREYSKGDPEGAHHCADDVLCELLETIGYEDVVKIYNDVDKWYA